MSDENPNQASPLHPHEPEVAPVLDPKGRCLVCSALVAADEMRAYAEGRLSHQNIYGDHERGPEIVAVLDAQQVVARAAEIQGFKALIEILVGLRTRVSQGVQQ